MTIILPSLLVREHSVLAKKERLRVKARISLFNSIPSYYKFHSQVTLEADFSSITVQLFKLPESYQQLSFKSVARTISCCLRMSLNFQIGLIRKSKRLKIQIHLIQFLTVLMRTVEKNWMKMLEQT